MQALLSKTLTANHPSDREELEEGMIEEKEEMVNVWNQIIKSKPRGNEDGTKNMTRKRSNAAIAMRIIIKGQ
jgi:hypothetical protein